MRKLVKKWIVYHVEDHEFQLKVPISVDPDKGTFWAEYPEGELITGATQTDCSNAVRAAIREHNMLDWTEHISLKLSTASSWDKVRIAGIQGDPHAGIAELKRFQRARVEIRQPKKWGAPGEFDVRVVYRYRIFDYAAAEAEWKVRAEKNGWSGPFPNGKESQPGHSATVFDYDAELWDQLCAICENLCELNRILGEICSQGDGETPEAVAARILSLGGPLALTGPVEEPEGTVIDAEAAPKRKKPPPPPPRRR